MSELIQTHFDKVHKVLGLYLTNRCNIACRHCGVDSGPWERKRLNLLSVKDDIIQLSHEGILTGIHVSGGEPFLFMDDLAEIGRISRDLGLLFAVNTNAFWAVEPERAAKRLRFVAPSQVILSSDEFHAEWFSPQRVAVAAKAAVDLGIRVSVAVCTIDGRPTPFVNELENALGEELISEIDFGCNKIDFVGRAKLLKEADLEVKSTELPDGPCYRVSRATVLQDGRVLACCNTTVAANTDNPLILGHLSTGLPSLLEEARKNPLVRALRVLGPRGIVELLPDNEREHLPPEYPTGDICSLCSAVTGSPKLLEAVRLSLSKQEVKKIVDALWSINVEPHLSRHSRGNSKTDVSGLSQS